MLRLASLLAGGAGGRVLVFKLLAAPEGASLSAYSTRAQELRRELERETVAALFGNSESESLQSAGSWASPNSGNPQSAMVSPVVRVATERDMAHEVRIFLESEPDALALLPLRTMDKTQDEMEMPLAGTRFAQSSAL